MNNISTNNFSNNMPVFSNTALLAKWVDLDIKQRIFNAKIGIIDSAPMPLVQQEPNFETPINQDRAL